jgi:glycosyltransferase involved in cell wall biosynthesis
LAASDGIEREVILVDSASTDKTIEIAKKYPIKIIQLRLEWPLSASSGRYIGFLHAKGSYIQFQDGDTILNINWFKHAIPFLEQSEDVAGIVGFITQKDYNNIVSKKWMEDSKNQKEGVIKYYEEDILLRRDILIEVGAFNPYLRAIEEGDLSLRITENNYKLVRIPYMMSHHLGGYQENIWSMLKRKCLYTRAYGQVLRYSKKNRKLFYKWLILYRFIISFSILILFGFFAVLLFIFEIQIALYLWFAGIAILFVDILFEKKSISVTIKHLLSMAIRWPFFIIGFMETPKKISSYPVDPIIIKN